MYDPDSPDEQPVPLPSAPLKQLSKTVVLQPPLTRRGTGPGLIVFLPSDEVLSLRAEHDKKPLDPEPVQKWAEEGFATVGISPGGGPVNETFALALDALAALESCDTKNKIGVIVYDQEIISTLIPTLDAALNHSKPVEVYFVAYCHPQTIPDVPTSPRSRFTFPTLLHVPTTEFKPLSDAHMELDLTELTIHTYEVDVQSETEVPSPFFVLPQTTTYAPGHAAVAHTRTLVFLRKHLGGPFFDLEKIWDEHTKYEFAERSVAKTMGTMVQEPYVNHVPTMTGGIGREALTAFYRDHFIFSNPPDAKLETISRTVGPDRVVDEFIYSMTHSRIVDWLLPGVPASGKKLRIPMMAVVNIRGDRLYNEHIWWDQATALQQAGILPTHLPYGEEKKKLRLPVAGAETADMLLDEVNGKSNAMFGEGWGIVDG